MPDPLDVGRIEKETRDKFSGAYYDPDHVCRPWTPGRKSYFDVQLDRKINWARRCIGDGPIMDLGCATGDILLSLAPQCRYGLGIDFAYPLIERARARALEQKVANAEFIVGNARNLCVRDSSFATVICFSALYYIPELEPAISEIARVLRPGGKCLLDFGNLYSLNTVVCKAHPALARPFHIPVRRMKALLANAGLTIDRHAAFQILPLWGRGPSWLRPLLRPGWTRVMEHQMGGRMLDEWISNCPGIRLWAFRHIFECSKPK